MNPIVIRYTSKVWTPTLRARSRWEVLSWRNSVGGFRTVQLKNVKTGAQVSVSESVLRVSFAAKRAASQIFTEERRVA